MEGGRSGGVLFSGSLEGFGMRREGVLSVQIDRF